MFIFYLLCLLISFNLLFFLLLFLLLFLLFFFLFFALLLPLLFTLLFIIFLLIILIFGIRFLLNKLIHKLLTNFDPLKIIMHIFSQSNLSFNPQFLPHCIFQFLNTWTFPCLKHQLCNSLIYSLLFVSFLQYQYNLVLV